MPAGSAEGRGIGVLEAVGEGAPSAAGRPGGWGPGVHVQGEGGPCLPPTARPPRVPCCPVGLCGGRGWAGTQALHPGSLAPTQEESRVLKQIQLINNEAGTGIYLFMMAFKSPIRSYMRFSCQFAKNLLKVLLM